MFVLLILISGYDAYAVWKSKHMIEMAKFQTKSGVFAGLLVPYELPKRLKKSEKKKIVHVRTAVLGGGDIGFPLLFSGVVLKSYGFWNAFVISPFVTAALLLLLVYGKKDRFYPAMPFLSAGAIVGFLVMLLINLI